MNNDNFLEKYGWLIVAVCVILTPFIITAALPLISALVFMGIIILIVFTTPIVILLFIDACKDIILFIIKAGVFLLICYFAYSVITDKELL